MSSRDRIEATRGVACRRGSQVVADFVKPHVAPDLARPLVAHREVLMTRKPAHDRRSVRHPGGLARLAQALTGSEAREDLVGNLGSVDRRSTW